MKGTSWPYLRKNPDNNRRSIFLNNKYRTDWKNQNQNQNVPVWISHLLKSIYRLKQADIFSGSPDLICKSSEFFLNEICISKEYVQKICSCMISKNKCNTAEQSSSPHSLAPIWGSVQIKMFRSFKDDLLSQIVCTFSIACCPWTDIPQLRPCLLVTGCLPG